MPIPVLRMMASSGATSSSCIRTAADRPCGRPVGCTGRDLTQTCSGIASRKGVLPWPCQRSAVAKQQGLTMSSNGGATTHAFGFKVQAEDSFGQDGSRSITALSGYRGSIMREAETKAIRSASSTTATSLSRVPARPSPRSPTVKRVLRSSTRWCSGGPS